MRKACTFNLRRVSVFACSDGWLGRLVPRGDRLCVPTAGVPAPRAVRAPRDVALAGTWAATRFAST